MIFLYDDVNTQISEALIEFRTEYHTILDCIKNDDSIKGYSDSICKLALHNAAMAYMAMYYSYVDGNYAPVQGDGQFQTYFDHETMVDLFSACKINMKKYKRSFGDVA